MKRRVHDGIAGALIALGTALGMWGDPVWLWLPAVVGLLMVQSAFTGFCPVYFLLDKLGMADGAPSTSPAT